MKPTPQEYALQLCQEIGYTTMFDKECNEGMTLPLHVAKKIAFIAVNKLIDYAKTFGDVTDMDVQYFQEVKTELEKL